MSIKSELERLKDMDIISLLLFALFKLKESDEYSSLSELSYVLDKKNLLRLCEFFGGCTITIPTIDELETMLGGLLLYQYIDIDKMPVEEAMTLADNKHQAKEIKAAYRAIKDVLTDYSISDRGGK